MVIPLPNGAQLHVNQLTNVHAEIAVSPLLIATAVYLTLPPLDATSRVQFMTA